MRSWASPLAAAVIASGAACATHAPYSTAYNPRASAEWSDGSADRCVFGNTQSLCLRSVVNPRGDDSAQANVVAGIREHIPAFTSECSAPDRTEIQALLGVAGCIDCGPGVADSLTTSATVIAFQSGIGEVDSMQWLDDRGGTLEHAARRLGSAVGKFVVESGQRCAPTDSLASPRAGGGSIQKHRR